MYTVLLVYSDNQEFIQEVGTFDTGKDALLHGMSLMVRLGGMEFMIRDGSYYEMESAVLYGDQPVGVVCVGVNIDGPMGPFKIDKKKKSGKNHYDRKSK